MLDKAFKWDDLHHLYLEVGEGLRVPEDFLYWPTTAQTVALGYTDRLRHTKCDWRNFFQIWYHLIFTVVQLPEAQHRFVELLAEIKSTFHALYDSQADQTEMLKWEDLPVFQKMMGGFWRCNLCWIRFLLFVRYIDDNSSCLQIRFCSSCRNTHLRYLLHWADLKQIQTLTGLAAIQIVRILMNGLSLTASPHASRGLGSLTTLSLGSLLSESLSNIPFHWGPTNFLFTKVRQT